MEFEQFQTATATLKKITTDYTGDETVSATYSVNIDPVFGWKRVFTDDSEVIEGQSTIMTSDTLEADFDFTHRKWKLEYNNHEYQIERPIPFYTIGTQTLEHIEVVLR